MEIRAPTPTILVADDEPDITTVLSEILSGHGYRVATASDGAQAWQKLQEEPFEAVLTDLKMPRMGGLELLRRINEARLPCAVIMMTGYATVETAIEALKIGAYDYIKKPFRFGELHQVVDRAIEKVRLAAENLQLKEQISLLRLSEAVASKLDLNEILGIVVDAALKEVSADGVEILFRPTGSSEFNRRVSQGRDGRVPKALADIRGLERALDGAPHLQLQGETLAPLLSVEAAGQVGAMLSIPLKRGEDVLGFLNAFTLGTRRLFQRREEKALVVLGDRAASSIENALLYEDLKATFSETIEGFAKALEAKDPWTKNHSAGVTKLCRETARVMGMNQGECAALERAGALHDIGKIGIRHTILTKPEKLTDAEYEEIKKHPAMGKEILQRISFLGDVVPVVFHHHERWDGRGYPEGLSAVEIPLGARIMAVADTYEAMTSDRAYRKRLEHDVAIAELVRCSGSQFDPDCVAAFLRVDHAALVDGPASETP